MIDEVEKHLQSFRNNISEDHKEWYEEAVALGQKIGAEPQLPRITGSCGRSSCQNFRSSANSAILDRCFFIIAFGEI